MRRGFSCFSGNYSFKFVHARVHDRWLRQTQSSQRRLDEGATTASQSSHRELVPTYPHQVYHLLCSHLRNMASSVDQYSSSQSKPVPSSCFRTSNIFSSFESGSRLAFDTEHSGRRPQEGSGGICFDPFDPGGEVRGCSVGLMVGMPDTALLVFILAAGRAMGLSLIHI